MKIFLQSLGSHPSATSPTIHTLPCTSPRVTIDKATWRHCDHPKYKVHIWVHSCCFIHPCNGTHDECSITLRVTVLKATCALLILPSQPLTATNLLLSSRFSSFQNVLSVGITQYVAFSNWLLSLSNIQIVRNSDFFFCLFYHRWFIQI